MLKMTFKPRISALGRPLIRRATMSETDPGETFYDDGPVTGGPSDTDGVITPGHTDADTFPIVGIGASAGGLKAFQEFFSALPARPGMAFVLVQHLSPDHESALAELVQSKTEMIVTQVADHPDVEADRVYVIPPGKHLEIEDGHLQLVEARRDRGRPAAVDHFFRTLAADQGPRAVCVVLSGTGSDGSLGLKNVKERGGLTMAQTPADAEYDGMPQSAINTGLVDLEGTAEALAHQLVGIRASDDRVLLPQTPDAALPENDHQALQAIFAHLRERTAHDFSDYKRTTILRRLARRLQVTRQPDLPAYAAYLRSTPEEIQALLRDFLISVTQFFRDDKAFEVLETETIPALFDGKTANDQVRVWVAGCATGEEAYSIAMLLCEHRERLDHPPDLQIFATDIDERALERAREGLYTDADAADVSPERLRRFFDSEGGGVRVKSELRQIVLFARHNLLADPPFSRLDLIACRNVLIYFNRPVQERVFATFHYSLRSDGFLFLGAAEGPSLISKGFTPSDKPARIYARRDVGGRPPIMALGRGDGFQGAPPARPDPSDPPREGLVERYREWTVEQYAPPRLLVDEHYDITHVFGDAGEYLVDREGPVTQNVVDKVLRAFRFDLRAALFRAFSAGESTDTRFQRITIGGKDRITRLHVGRAGGAALQDGLAEVVFIELDPTTVAALGSGLELKGEPLSDGVAAHLEEELRQTRRRLQLTVEESETSTEELKASNEELQSINEELQSTTEELETSKEELQSTNEELQTVNQELKNKVEELVRSNSDLQNLIASTDIATVFLDRALQLKRYTPRAADLFHVRPGDMGRPFDHIVHRLQHESLSETARRVLDTLVQEEIDVESEDGRWYSARVNPYRTTDDRIDGIVLTFVDVTELHDAVAVASRRAAQQEAVAELSRLALGDIATSDVFDRACELAAAALGAEFVKVLRHQPEAGVLALVAGVGWAEGLVGAATVTDSQACQAGFTLTADAPVVVTDAEAEARFALPPLLTDHDVQSGLSVSIPSDAGPAWGLLGIHSVHPRTFTDEDAQFAEAVANVLSQAIQRTDAKATIAEQLAEIEAVYGTAPVGLAYLDRDLRYRRINERLAQINGLPPQAHIGKRGHELFPMLADVVEPVMQQILDTGEAVEHLEFRGATLRDPTDERDWLCSYVPDLDGGGEVRGVSVVVRDITERKQSERERAQALGELDFVLSAADIGIWSRDLADGAVRVDERARRMLGLEPGASLEDALARVHPDDLPAVEAAAEAARTDPDYEFSYPLRLPNPDGGWRWFEVRGRTLPASEGTAGGSITGVLYDVTALREATEQASRRLSQIEAYFDAVPFGLSVFDLERRYVRTNDGTADLMGVERDRLRGQRVSDFSPALAEITDPLVERVIETGEPVSPVSLQVVSPADPNDVRDWLLHAHPIHADGHVAAVVVVSQNVTELSRTQAELRVLTGDLEARVASRTAQVRALAAELTNAEDNERKRLAMVLHDDLQQIIFGAQMKLVALQKADPDVAAKLVVEVENALRLAAQSCRSLSIDLSPLTLSEEGLMGALEIVSRRYLEAYGLNVSVQGTIRLSLSPPSQTLLIRVVRELLFNVVKHAGVDAVTMEVSTEGDQVCIEVADEGAGFDLGAASSRGLGLASVRERLNLIGGTIELTSAPGSGTRVLVCVSKSDL